MLSKAEVQMAATTPRLQQQGQLLPTLLSREGQVITVWLRTGRSRFRHMFTNCIGGSVVCTFGNGTLPERLSDSKNLWEATWPPDAAIGEKLYGPAENLQCTATYIQSSCQSEWQQRRRMLWNSPMHSVASFLFGWVCKHQTNVFMNDRRHHDK